MNAKSTLLSGFLLLAGCATTAPAPKGATLSPAPTPMAVAEAPAPTPRETLALAEQLHASELGTMRGDRFATERQLTLLRQEVLLYTQFLERAEGDPELLPAVRKSRERIADAQDTIVYLEGLLKADEQPPAAR
jgi:hypothetical protein